LADVPTEEPLLITTSIAIDASVEDVWSQLIDFSEYGAWNPLTPHVEGEAKEGEDVTLHVSLLGAKLTRVHTISQVREPSMLAWTIKSPFRWWLRGERRQVLVGHPDGGCSYTNEEEICGVASVFVALFLRGVLRRALEAVGAGLKSHVERPR